MTQRDFRPCSLCGGTGTDEPCPECGKKLPRDDVARAIGFAREMLEQAFPGKCPTIVTSDNSARVRVGGDVVSNVKASDVMTAINIAVIRAIRRAA